MLLYFACKHVIATVEMYAFMIHLHAGDSVRDSCDQRGS